MTKAKLKIRKSRPSTRLTTSPGKTGTASTQAPKNYHQPQPARVPPPFSALTKAGVHGFPEVDEAQLLLARTMRKHKAAGAVLDLSAMGGLLASLTGVTLQAVEGSAAALATLKEAGIDHKAAAIGDDLSEHWEEKARTVALVLAGDRGNAYTAAQILWAHEQTPVGGTLFLAGDKDKGFDRYMRQAAALFGTGEVVAREGGMRVAKLVKRPGKTPPQPEPERYTRGELTVVGRAGVFSAGKVDKASALLLGFLEEIGMNVKDKKVLDIGTGTGILGAWAAKEGAAVTMIDSDLNSVRSAEQTLAANGLTGRVLHSDVGAALDAGEQFDVILTNPPFHVGRGVLLDVAYEFMALAARSLTTGGVLYVVANDFLPYEQLLSEYGDMREECRQSGFKVLSLRRS